MHTIYISPRPSDPTISRIDGDRRAQEALLPVLESLVHSKHLERMPGTLRESCNCAFDGPSLGLSTVHCFTCDGRGFYDRVWGIVLPSDFVRSTFAPRIRAAGFEIRLERYPDTTTEWIP